MRISLLIFCCFILKGLLAGPIPIQPITHEWHPLAYYVTQKAEWQAVTERDDCDDMAWYHYYLAAHFANVFGHQPAFDLEGILAAAENRLTEKDFALHYLRCRRAETSELRWAHLLAAHAAAPERPEAYPGLAAYYLIAGDLKRHREFMQLLDARNPFPRGAVEWNYNQLNSVAEHGILLTHGDNDTYGSWLLQAVYQVRPDVSIINLPLFINFADYRNRIVRELAITPPDLSDPAKAAENTLRAMADSDRPVYLGVGAHDGLIAKHADQLFLTGLTFRYDRQAYNNLGALVDNYRRRWRLDELHRPLDSGARRKVTDQLEQNYLPALLELREHFLTTDPAEAALLERTVTAIAERNGLAARIADYFQPGHSPLASESPGLSARKIAKGFAFIPGGTYYDAQAGRQIPNTPLPDRTKVDEIREMSIKGFSMMRYEVSNADYQLFLEDLLRQRRFDLLDTVAIADTDYAALLPDSLYSLPEIELFHSNGAALAEHPVTNISHRAAELYAAWLTQVYNQDARKKDGREVRFRLPRPEEFAYAATGGRALSPFPWGGPAVNNAKGCYLANFNTLLSTQPDGESTTSLDDYLNQNYLERYAAGEVESCGTDDGGYLTVNVAAYHPNDFGLYNMSGNAAEMTSQPGTDIGGSYLDHVSALEIGRLQQRPLPHPAVGFRLVMEYRDE